MRTKSLKKFTKFFLRKDHFCAWFLTFSKNLAESFSKAEKRNWEKFFFQEWIQGKGCWVFDIYSDLGSKRRVLRMNLKKRFVFESTTIMEIAPIIYN